MSSSTCWSSELLPNILTYLTALTVCLTEAQSLTHFVTQSKPQLSTARKYLSRALELNPHFNPVQALVAQKALAE